jgi:hypothetical protein
VILAVGYNFRKLNLQFVEAYFLANTKEIIDGNIIYQYFLECLVSKSTQDI